jgi:hypothetical protein
MFLNKGQRRDGAVSEIKVKKIGYGIGQMSKCGFGARCVVCYQSCDDI